MNTIPQNTEDKKRHYPMNPHSITWIDYRGLPRPQTESPILLPGVSQIRQGIRDVDLPTQIFSK